MDIYTNNLTINENLIIEGQIMDDDLVRKEVEKRKHKSYGFFRTVWSVIYVTYWQTIGYLHDPDYSAKIRDIMQISQKM